VCVCVCHIFSRRTCRPLTGPPGVSPLCIYNMKIVCQSLQPRAGLGPPLADCPPGYAINRPLGRLSRQPAQITSAGSQQRQMQAPFRPFESFRPLESRVSYHCEIASAGPQKESLLRAGTLAMIRSRTSACGLFCIARTVWFPERNRRCRPAAACLLLSLLFSLSLSHSPTQHCF
jgi:hypothetical protein